MCSASLFWEQESICLRVYVLMTDLSEMNTNNLQGKVKKLGLLEKGFYETYFHIWTTVFQTWENGVPFLIP